jgi:hypothetical protein
MIPVVAFFSRAASTLNSVSGVINNSNNAKVNMNIRMDTRAFDAALKKYIEVSKKIPSEVINTKAYSVACKAVSTTATTDTSKIEAQLRAPSKTSGKAPVGAILVNIKRKSKGLPGVTGPKMDTELNKYIRARKRTANFLRAGWIPAIQELAKFIKSKAGTPRYKKLKTHGSPKGGGRGAKTGWKVSAEIFNTVSGGKPRPNIDNKGSAAKVATELERGLKKALNFVMADMQVYIERKVKQATQIMNR